MELRRRMVAQWRRLCRLSLSTHSKLIITEDSIGKTIVILVKWSCALTVAGATLCVLT